MVCRLVGAKSSSDPMLDIVNWNLSNKLQWNLHRNSNIFIRQNAFENAVCEMSTILSLPPCVNLSRRWFPPADSSARTNQDIGSGFSMLSHQITWEQKWDFPIVLQGHVNHLTNVMMQSTSIYEWLTAAIIHVNMIGSHCWIYYPGNLSS